MQQCERRLDQRGRVKITSKSVQRLLSRRTSEAFPELHGVTAYFIRERLKNLNHGTVLRAGRGARTAQFEWTERVDPGTLHSFAQLRRVLGGSEALAGDAYQISMAFQARPFDGKEFVQMMQRRRQAMLHRRWYDLATKAPREDAQFTRIVLTRLRSLVHLGLVERASLRRYRLSAKGEEAVHWFDLFVHSVEYPVDSASWPTRPPAHPLPEPAVPSQPATRWP